MLHNYVFSCVQLHVILIIPLCLNFELCVWQLLLLLKMLFYYYGCYCYFSTWIFSTMNITIIAIIKHAKVSTINNIDTVIVAPSKHGVESTMISHVASTIMEKLKNINLGSTLVQTYETFFKSPSCSTLK